MNAYPLARAVLVLAAASSIACGAPPTDNDASTDASTTQDAATTGDVASTEASALDSSAPDAALIDAGAMDAGALTDGASQDQSAPPSDAGPRDTGAPVGDGSTSNPTLPAMPAAGCPTITPNADATFMINGGPVRAYFRYDPARLDADSALVLAWEQSGGMGGLSATNYAAAGMRRNDVLVGPYKSGQFYDRVGPTADAIVACAAAQLRINVRRIGTTGFSAGANAAWEMVSQRSAYVASAAIFSAGTSGSASPTAHRYALMVGYGSMTADVPFYGLTTGIRDSHVMRGFPVVSCSHGMGHRFPPEAAAAVGRFLVEHPWDTRPTPWTTRPAGTPTVPMYCTVSNPG